MKKTILITLFMAVTVALTSCSTSSKVGETTTSASYEEGVPGGTYVETYKLEATVTAIDAANRKVTLTTANGKRETIKCGPEVVNFDQIEVGDKVKVTMSSELVLAMADAENPPPDAAAKQVSLAPVGAKPAGAMTETQQYTATVTAIDLKRHKATLRFPDDTTRTFAVRKDVDLSQRKVGEKVAVRVRVGVAISVEEP